MAEATPAEFNRHAGGSPPLRLDAHPKPPSEGHRRLQGLDPGPLTRPLDPPAADAAAAPRPAESKTYSAAESGVFGSFVAPFGRRNRSANPSIRRSRPPCAASRARSIVRSMARFLAGLFAVIAAVLLARSAVAQFGQNFELPPRPPANIPNRPTVPQAPQVQSPNVPPANVPPPQVQPRDDVQSQPLPPPPSAR